MELEVGNIFIEDVRFGPETKLDGRCLVVNPKALSEFLCQRDARLRKVEVYLARPGESTRILCVKDVIEPRSKIADDLTGEGRIHVLKQLAVVTCGKIVGFQEGIIDMSDPGALYTPFSRTINLVLEIAVQKNTTPHRHEEAVRKAGLAAAAFIAETGRDIEPEALETFADLESLAVSPKLPRIAYLYLLLSQGLLHDTYVFGDDAKKIKPCIMAPRILMAGGIVSGNCVSACDKNTTYHHQNNPVIAELYRKHGKKLNFVGVVLSNEPAQLSGKENSAASAIELLKSMKVQGVIISKEGFGNPDADQMMLTRGLEQAGIKVVSITDEYAGTDGLSQSLADATPEADAVISVGNANERIILPPMKRMLGPLEDVNHLAGAYPQSLLNDGSLEIELQAIIGATNELGYQTLSSREV